MCSIVCCPRPPAQKGGLIFLYCFVLFDVLYNFLLELFPFWVCKYREDLDSLLFLLWKEDIVPSIFLATPKFTPFFYKASLVTITPPTIPYVWTTRASLPSKFYSHHPYNLTRWDLSLNVKGLNHLAHFHINAIPKCAHSSYPHIFLASAPKKKKGVLVAIKNSLICFGKLHPCSWWQVHDSSLYT